MTCTGLFLSRLYPLASVQHVLLIIPHDVFRWQYRIDKRRHKNGKTFNCFQKHQECIHQTQSSEIYFLHQTERKESSLKTQISILSFVVLYLFLFVIGTIIVVVTGVDPVTASSSVATCMAAIGPGLGTVGPIGSFANMPELSKVVLSLLMIVGRLEIITFLRFLQGHSGSYRCRHGDDHNILPSF